MFLLYDDMYIAKGVNVLFIGIILMEYQMIVFQSNVIHIVKMWQTCFDDDSAKLNNISKSKWHTD